MLSTAESLLEGGGNDFWGLMSIYNDFSHNMTYPELPVMTGQEVGTVGKTFLLYLGSTYISNNINEIDS